MCSKYIFKEKYSLCKKKHAKNSDMQRDKHLHAHYCFVWLFSEQVSSRTHLTVITAGSRRRTSYDMKHFIYFFVNFSSIPQPKQKVMMNKQSDRRVVRFFFFFSAEKGIGFKS